MSSDQQGDNNRLCPGLALGTVLRIQVEGLGSILTNLIGLEDGLYLIIKTPPLAEIKTKLFQRNHVIIRYLFDGQVIGFRSTLLGLIKEPFRFAILSYPESIQKVNLRQHGRVNCMLPAELKTPEGMHEILIEDISIGGCFFELNAPRDGKFPSIKIGDEALLILNLSEKGDNIILTIIVRTIKCDAGMMKLGVQFKKSDTEGADAASFAAINTYIESI